MSIAGCYDLRLQCDVVKCAHGKFGEGRIDEFTGDDTGGRARARARKAGWWFNWKMGTCACPPCAKEGHRPTEPV